MTAKQLAALIGAGLSAAGGQFSITAAYFYAPAKEISVYDYSQLIFSMLLGFVFFGQIPEFMSVIGYAVIIASAVMMFIYNTRRKDV
jgi:drug/metabolite transporter (DMT)-like permease